jgi:hypothetical protein
MLQTTVQIVTALYYTLAGYMLTRSWRRNVSEPTEPTEPKKKRQVLFEDAGEEAYHDCAAILRKLPLPELEFAMAWLNRRFGWKEEKTGA